MDNVLLAISPGHGSFGSSLWTGMTLIRANGWHLVPPPRKEAVDRRIEAMIGIIHYFLGTENPATVIVEYLPRAFSEKTNLREISIVEGLAFGVQMKVKGHFKEDIAGYYSCSYPDCRVEFVYPKTWMDGELAAAVQYRAEQLIRSGEIKTGGPIGISKRAAERRRALTAIALGWWGVNRVKIEGMEEK